LIDQNITTMKGSEERDRLIQRLADMKAKFNDLVKTKADLQQDLITSEEEKLKVSKALIELQIENTRINETLHNQTFDVNTKLMHAENDLLEQNVKEERASKAISELQDRLTDAINDRKDIEIEFIALKKNFYNLRRDLDQERVKNENLGVELINLVNEHKTVQRDLSTNEK
jgi:chromosome segregation ATPase